MLKPISFSAFTFVKYACYLLIIGLGFIACQKESINPEEEKEKEEEVIEEVVENTMTAKIDGAAWEATSILVTMQNGVINITGVSDDDRQISITVESAAEGEYPLNLVSKHVAVYTPVKNSNDVFSSNGDASAGGAVNLKTVNMNEKQLTGSFEFKAVQPGGNTKVNVSEGVFTKVKIQ